MATTDPTTLALPVSGVPMGTIVAFGLSSSSIPNGWLLCDGSAIPANYQSLITALGSPNTPNLSGRNLTGTGTPANTTQTDGSNPSFTSGFTLALGNTGGQSQVTLSLAQMPSHQHLGWGLDAGNGWGTGQSTGKSFTGANGHDNNNYLWGSSYTGGNISDANKIATNNGTVTGKAAGTTSAHNNMAPYYAVNYIIYAGG